MNLFDAYLFVDWSAASALTSRTPSEDAIWVGHFHPALDEEPASTYHRTRSDAIAVIESLLVEHVRQKRRVLVGFDFPYGYPAGLAERLGWRDGSDGAPWAFVWELLSREIEDGADNRNNRFEVAAELNRRLGGNGPFWGCPAGAANECLLPTKDGTNGQESLGLARLRRTERLNPGVQEAWKLAYPGSVGSQALVGIPRLHHLRHHPQLAPVSRVWPFETGFTSDPTPPEDDGAFVLHAEIWPGVVKARVREMVDREPEKVRDEAQVEAMCLWAADEDSEGGLGDWLAAPRGLSGTEEVAVCVREEGWILGTGGGKYAPRQD